MSQPPLLEELVVEAVAVPFADPVVEAAVAYSPEAPVVGAECC